MTMQEADLEPETAEVLQEEAPLTTVPVAVSGPVRVQLLPRKSASTLTRAFASARPVRLLTADHYRASVKLVGDDVFLVAFTEAAAQDPSAMAQWPGSVPLEVTAVVDVWVACASNPTGGIAPVNISIVAERWAVGE